MIPIDPITALEGLQSAIGLVRKAAKVANDLGGLAPMIGKLFDAKSQATKAMVEAKRSGNKSNFALAMQIETSLMQTAKLEAELQLLYMQTGNIDVWNKIKARQAQMDADDAHELSMFNEQERKRKQTEAELNEWAIIIGAVSFIIFLFGIGTYELIEFCQTGNRCGR